MHVYVVTDDVAKIVCCITGDPAVAQRCATSRSERYPGVVNAVGLTQGRFIPHDGPHPSVGAARPWAL